MDHPFADYAQQSTNFQYMTIPRILEFIRALNREMNLNIKASTGLKAEICSRISTYLNHWRQTNDASNYLLFKQVYARFEGAGRYGASPAQAAYAAAPYGSSPAAAARPAAPAYPNYGQNQYAWQNPQASGSQAAVAPRPPPPKPVIKWKESPLFKIVGTVSEMVYLKESHSQNDRQSGTAAFTLSEDVRQRVERSLLHPTVAPRVSLRLLCTSSTYYGTNGATQAGRDGLLMEFPQTSEVRVNNALVAANLKGMKKKPGSCPPADLQKGKAGETRLVRMGAGQENKVELVHVNSGGPSQVKRFYMQVCLIESTTPAELVSQVMKQPPKTPADVISGMKQDAVDAEIQIGALTLNLKCPLSYVRMSTPIRSVLCDHLQCFEASSWFQVNEQTPQWACPICERVLKVHELFVDQFSQEIIKLCPDSIDEVLVEPDGLWHSSNKKYGSPAWLAAHPVAANQGSVAPSSRTATPSASDLSKKGKSKEIFTLSSDDDDDDGERSPHPPRATSSAAPRRAAPVSMDGPIDLTLSSDEDEPAPPPRVPARSSSSLGGGGGGGSDGSSLKRGYSGGHDGQDKRTRYESNGYSPYEGTNGSGSSTGAASLENLRAQVLDSQRAPPASMYDPYGASRQGGLRGGASTSSNGSIQDPRTDHPSYHLPSSRRKDDDDPDDSYGLVAHLPLPGSIPQYSPARDEQGSSGRWQPYPYHASALSPSQGSPPSSSSDLLASPPPALSYSSAYNGLPPPPSPASLAALANSKGTGPHPDLIGQSWATSAGYGNWPAGGKMYEPQAGGRYAEPLVEGSREDWGQRSGLPTWY